ncbi:MAG: phosphonate ABC transporter, permease protein PhnE [Planctomycetes bacterium]|nr:phosphonate ABC transporter, permease protein PhnE [Planctomycetota bacterium]
MTTSLSTTLPPAPGRIRRAALRYSIIGTLVAMLIWCWMGTGMSSFDMVGSGPRIADFLDRMLPPDLTWTSSQNRPFAPPLRIALTTVAITLQISLLGTAIGFVLAIVLGFLAAENLTPHWVHHPLKIALALLRSIPVILLALLFVTAVGLGAVPGVLAIGVHSVGMLGKLFAEEVEGADAGVWEAMDSAGANWLQKVRYAIWPQVAAQIYSLTLFRLDMNIRESAVLGLVGVAGLGLWIENYRRAFDYPSVATLVIVTMMVVLVVEQLSIYIRRKLK